MRERTVEVDPMNAPSEPRCPACDTVLVHAGAICVICDDQAHYEAPIRTSPPLNMPAVGGDGETETPELRHQRVS
jgi:hypothetical protein